MRDKSLIIINTLQHSFHCTVIATFCEFIMALDIKKYLKHLDDCDLTEAQKLEHIQEVKAILENFIDTAFGVHPVQLCLKNSREKDLQSPKGNVESRQSTYFSKNATEYRKALHLHNER